MTERLLITKATLETEGFLELYSTWTLDLVISNTFSYENDYKSALAMCLGYSDSNMKYACL